MPRYIETLDNGLFFDVTLREEFYYEKAVKLLNELQREQLLKLHDNKIWQGKDGRWRTYVSDKDKGRILKCRNELRTLEDDILRTYIYIDDPTVEDVFEEYIRLKRERKEIEASTEVRYRNVFKRYYKKLKDIKIRQISEMDIEDHLMDMIVEENMTKKEFNNLKTITRGIFIRAKKSKVIKYSINNVLQDMEVSRNIFRRINHRDEELVFLEKEIPIVYDALVEDLDMRNLGLLLMFKTGLRIGELAALRKDNITDYGLVITSTEVSYSSDGTMICYVRDRPKTEAGIRHVVMLNEDYWILKKIKNMNPFGEYLFEENGKRLTTYNFRDRLRSICKKIAIINKSPNKIRKTYASALLDSGVPESVVISQMGHTQISTTKTFYYFDRHELDERKVYISKVQAL